MDGILRSIKESIAGIIDSGVHISVANTTQLIAKQLGLSERMINYTHIEIRNALNESKFKRIPFNKRALFVSHCLRNSRKCKAPYNQDGLQCRNCKNCKIPEIIELGKKFNYKKIAVLPGGSMVAKLVEKHKPKAVIGIACYMEASMGIDKLNSLKIPSQAVMLLKDGCIDTDVNLEEVKEKMELIDEKLNDRRTEN